MGQLLLLKVLLLSLVGSQSACRLILDIPAMHSEVHRHKAMKKAGSSLRPLASSSSSACNSVRGSKAHIWFLQGTLIACKYYNDHWVGHQLVNVLAVLSSSLLQQSAA